MELSEFVKKFYTVYDLEVSEELLPETKFRKVEGWDSITSLNVLAFLDSELNTEVTREELDSVTTIEELFSLVERKRASV